METEISIKNRVKFFHHEDSQALEQTDQKSFAFPVLEIFKTWLVKILQTSQVILRYFVIARCLVSFLSTLPWQQILAEIADISAVSLLPLLLSLYEERIWQKAQKRGSQPVSTCQTLNTQACADRWETNRSDQSPSETITH